MLLLLLLLLHLTSLLVLLLKVLHLGHLLLLHHLLLWLLVELIWVPLHLLLQILNGNTWDSGSQVDIHVVELLVDLNTATGKTHDVVVHELLLNFLLVLGLWVLHLELRLLVLRSHHCRTNRMGNSLRIILQILVISLLFKLLIILQR